MSEPNDNMILDIEFNHTGEISIPNKIVDQVIGQDEAQYNEKAAAQRRHVMLIGEPGTERALLGAALAEMLPQNELEDILVVANPENTNNPKIVTLPSGEGRTKVDAAIEQSKKGENVRSLLSIIIPLLIIVLGSIFSPEGDARVPTILGSIFVGIIAFMILNNVRSRSEILALKVIVDNSEENTAPFVDGTGSHSGALLGDVRHDPFQSGGLAHLPMKE